MKRRSPIVVNVPHSSTFIPEEEKRFFVTPNLEHELLVMTDHYCDDLYDAGYEMIRFRTDRIYVSGPMIITPRSLLRKESAAFSVRWDTGFLLIRRLREALCI